MVFTPYSFWYMLFNVKSTFAKVSLHRGSHTAVVAAENLPKEVIVPRIDHSSYLSVFV